MNVMTDLVIQALRIPKEVCDQIVEASPATGPQFVVTFKHTPHDDELCRAFALHPLFIETTWAVAGVRIYFKVPDKMKTQIAELLQAYADIDEDRKELLSQFIGKCEA